MTFSRALRRLAAAGGVLVLAACAAEELTVPKQIPLEEQTWAASLQVTLSQFTKLPSGVYYADSVVGGGETLTGTPTVSVYYSAYLPNGTKVDERASSSTPICFPLSGLIGGWQVGMQGMKVGGKRRLLIPPEYGYGAGGAGPIPGNSNLLFNIELKGTGCTP